MRTVQLLRHDVYTVQLMLKSWLVSLRLRYGIVPIETYQSLIQMSSFFLSIMGDWELFGHLGIVLVKISGTYMYQLNEGQ